MKTLILNIKNMVCPRCILVVQNELEELGALISTIRLGYVAIQVPDNLSKEKIASRLNPYGFELIEDKEEILMERIKLGIQHYIEILEKSTKELMLSDFLSHEIGKNYNFISKHFSKNEGITIETYYINKRVDRVKELIKYDELNLSEMAVKLRYSSVHYLSSQFKRVTGLSVSKYKEVIRNENQYYNNLSQALDDLREKGYTYNFSNNNDCLECKDICANFQITECYRFDENEDAAGRSVIYGIETKDGLKGILVENCDHGIRKVSKKFASKMKG